MFPQELWQMVLDVCPLRSWVQLRLLLCSTTHPGLAKWAPEALHRVLAAGGTQSTIIFFRHATQHKGAVKGLELVASRGDLILLQLLSQPCQECGRGELARSTVVRTLDNLFNSYFLSSHSIPCIRWLLQTWNVQQQDMDPAKLARVLCYDPLIISDTICATVSFSTEFVELVVRSLGNIVTSNQAGGRKACWLLSRYNLCDCGSPGAGHRCTCWRRYWIE